MPVRAALVAALVLLTLPAAVAAHGGAPASLVVTVDHVEPGSTLPIIASDFGSDSKVGFEIVSGDYSARLGQAAAGADGHFTADLSLPTNLPLGWAELKATGDDGSYTTTQVLVGPLTDTTVPRPGRAASWWQDPATVALAAFLIGTVLAALWLVFRPRTARKARPR